MNLAGKTIYLSGPISKVDWKEAQIKFAALELKVRPYKPGHIYNPLDFMAPPQEMDELERWCWYMKQSVRALSLCDTIVLMDNYVISKGSRLEKYLAEELGIEVLHEKQLSSAL